jgi:PKD repeat protein
VAIVLVAAQVVLATPPTVQPIGISNDTPLVGEEVTFTSDITDPENDVTAIEWDFDYDEANSVFTVDATGAAPDPHAYANAGTKIVALRVTDGIGGDPTDIVDVVLVTDQLTVQEPPNVAPTASFTATPSTAQLNQTVTFNGSASTDSDGTIAAYEWDLDDNGSFETVETVATGGDAITSRSYPSSDPSITVRLRVIDNDDEPSAITTQSVRVNAPPLASLTARPNPAQTGAPITFNGSASDTDGTIATYEWDFDNDGTFDAAGQNTSHTYSTAGTRTVQLRVRDNDGGTAFASNTVTVTGTPPPNIPPQASFRISPASPFTGDTVTLSSTSSDPDGPLASQDWDTDNDGQFDDASGPVASRSFPSAGTQTVRLRVVDRNGASAVAVGRVDVRARLITPLTVLNSNVTISGRFSNSSTTIGRLIVKAPAGAQIAPACKGRGCPKRVKKLRAKAAAKRVRVRAFERRWRPGAKITIRVTKPGFIGTHTQFKIRRGKRPKRIELCVQPAAKRASACPQS